MGIVIFIWALRLYFALAVLGLAVVVSRAVFMSARGANVWRLIGAAILWPLALLSAGGRSALCEVIRGPSKKGSYEILDR